MGLSRKNLMVDAEKVPDLAQQRQTSESAAVRQAVDDTLAAEEVMAVVRELHVRAESADAFRDVADEPDMLRVGLGRHRTRARRTS